jgi:hypothetical protein
MLLFQNRRHRVGRVYKGYIRGDLILDPKNVKPGDKIITVSHQFSAENLAIVVDQGPDAIARDEKFYATWLQFAEGGETFLDTAKGFRKREPGEPLLGPEVVCYWNFTLGNTDDVHKAVKVPTLDLNEVDTYTARELLDIMTTFNGESMNPEYVAQDLPFYREHVTYILANAMSKLKYAKV